jgi:hypothetical protein
MYNQPPYRVLGSYHLSAPFTYCKQLVEDHYLFAVAECSLEGWGVLSSALSKAFLAKLSEQLQVSDIVGDASIPLMAKSAFHESLAGFHIETPAWVSAQYAVAYLSRKCFCLSWIGDMYARVWNNAQLIWSNQPHIAEVQNPEGKRISVVLKFLRITQSADDSTLPDKIDLQPMDCPLVIFLGNSSAAQCLSRLEGQIAFRELLQSLTGAGFREGIVPVEKAFQELCRGSVKPPCGLLCFHEHNAGRGKEQRGPS